MAAATQPSTLEHGVGAADQETRPTSVGLTDGDLQLIAAIAERRLLNGNFQADSGERRS